MEKDIHNFTSKLRLTEYFPNENDRTFDKESQPLVKNKRKLKENDSVLIKEADNGGAVVAMNKTYYYSMVVKSSRMK